MKHNKLKYLVGLYFSALMASSFAVEPKLKESELVIPKPDSQHTLSTKRVSARLTQSHYRKFVL